LYSKDIPLHLQKIASRLIELWLDNNHTNCERGISTPTPTGDANKPPIHRIEICLDWSAGEEEFFERVSCDQANRFFLNMVIRLLLWLYSRTSRICCRVELARATLWSLVLESLHEAVVHVQLLMAVEEGNFPDCLQ
jgi:hypothetical protein